VDASTPPLLQFLSCHWTAAPRITLLRAARMPISYWNGTQDPGPGDNIEIDI